MRNKIVIGLYALITIGPLAMGLGYSLLYSFGLIGLMNDGFTLEHWIRLWNSSDALGTLWYTFWLTIVSLLLTLSLSLLLSWKYVHGQASGIWYRSLFLPLLFPPLIAALAWFYLLSPAGIVSRIAYHLNVTNAIEAFPRLVNDQWSVGILATHVFLVFPLFTLLFIEQARKESIPDLFKMARTLGSKKSQFLRKIYVPLLLLKSRPVIWLYGVFLFGTYEVPLLLGQSSPRTMTIFITEKMSRYNLNDIPVGHAMAVVYSLLVLVFIHIFVRKKAITLF